MSQAFHPLAPSFSIALQSAKAPSGDESYLRVVLGYESQLAKLKKSDYAPASAWEGFELAERDSAKSVCAAQGYDRTVQFLVLRDGLKTFFLHEAIRKNVSFDGTKTKSIVLDASLLREEDAVRVADAFAGYLTLLAHEPMKFGKKAAKKDGAKKKAPTVSVFVQSGAKASKIEAAFARSVSQAHAANLVRHFAELPGNELRPSHYVDRVRKLAKGWDGVEMKFIDQRALEKRGAGGFLAVARAVPNSDFGIVHLTYKPRGKKSGRKIALVGKGLCFDTGGYNVKVGDFMFDMHRDMTGSALALATFGHLVAQGSHDELHAYLALAENLISPTAYRPNDVVIASNGVSIEVVDTDAEGRMVLSDTLVYACENDPDLVIDFATLTGSVIRAIDTRRSGVYSNDDALRELAVECGEDVGERVWGFPIGEDYWDGIHSDYADVRQCATTNSSDHIYAATFLSSFVKKDVPWLHVDLAAESNKGGLGLAPKDVTGYGVRLADAIVARFRPRDRAKDAKNKAAEKKNGGGKKAKK